MQIELTPKGESSLKALMENGASASEVVEQAITEKLAREKERDAIQAGIDDMEAGKTQSFEEFDAEFRRKHGLNPAHEA